MANDTQNQQHLVPSQVASFLVEPLQAASVVLSAGPRIIDSSAPISVPIAGEVDETAVGYVAEGEAIPDNYDISGGSELDLMPSTRKPIATISRISNQLIRSANQNVSQMVSTSIVRDMRAKVDRELLSGSGTTGAIPGIFTQATETAPFDTADIDTVLDASHWFRALEIVPSQFWLTPDDFRALRSAKYADGRSMLQPDPSQPGAQTIDGIPVRISARFPQSALVDLSNIVVVRDLDAQVVIDTSRYLEYDQTAIRTMARFDVGLLRPEAVLLLNKAAGV